MNSSKECPKRTYRKNAVMAGGLFIIGTVAGTISAVVSNPVLSAPDYLNRISTNQNLVIIGITLQLIMAIACAGIALALYPVLRRFSEGLAIGAVAFRLIENMLQILKAVSMASLLALSLEFSTTESPANSYFQSIGAIINSASDWMIHGAGLICFSIGAAMYYILFYQYRLLPRWLSVWGLVSLAMVIIGSVLVLLHVIPAFGTVQVVLNLPIFLQEMVFAVWLIVKGFDQSVIASKSENLEIN